MASGELAEWLKAHAWKACILQKGIGGSNPSFSALYYILIYKLYLVVPR